MSDRSSLGSTITMREDNFPHPVSDPEADGLPGTADDDSTAWDDVESPRISDGPDPGMLPADEALAVDRYGTTPEEARIGESLDRKMAREEPDPALAEPTERPDTTPSPISAESFDAEPVNEENDLVDRDTSLDASGVIDPRPDSPVSMYDTGIGGGDGPVGRLVEPDEGVHEDTEADMVAFDAGAAGGGPSAEELAMHEVPER